MPDSMLHPLTLSIVIPAPADTAALEETLVSVLENRPAGCEVIVALGCPYDDPWNIAEEVRFVQAPGAGLVGCTNLGIAASSGDVVHVLAAGWRATPGWTDAALERFVDGGVGAVIAVSAGDSGATESLGVRYKRGGRRVALARPGRGTDPAAGADRRVGARRPLGPVVGPRLEAGFWRADVVRDGGSAFTTACGERLADADMALGLAARGLVAVVEEGVQVVAGAQPAAERGFRAGLHGERLFWRSLAGRSLLPALVLHLVEVVRHSVAQAPLATVPMLLGRLLGVLQAGSYRARHRELRGWMAEGESAAITAGATTVTEATGAERTTDTDIGTGPETGTDAETAGTIRIDAGHDVLEGPRRRGGVSTATEPLRKSA